MNFAYHWDSLFNMVYTHFMKQTLLFITFLSLPCLLATTPLFAKGHGGGGGHGGGHASHSNHSSNFHANSSSNSARTQANTRRSNTKAIITRSTSPSVIAAHHSHYLPGRSASSLVAGPALSRPVASAHPSGGYVSPYENYGTGGYYGTGYYGNYYGNPYAYYPYYSGPFFYDPYYSPFTSYFGFMCSPNYYPVNSPNYANNNNESQISSQPMDGFVVFYNDTLSGAVTVAKRAISMETTDSGKDYDYRFREKDPGLQYVTVYNEDDKQLNLVRLNGDAKKLWRVIHTGKLNVYDGHRGFLYKPEDVDLKTLTIYYNGEISTLNSSSVKTAKEWLTGYVNRAYGLSLDARDFSWKELLIYVDKLD